MPPEYLAPGVYVEERPSGSRTIAGVPTWITAFVGRTVSGPTDAPTRVTSFTAFERLCGGLSPDSPLSYAVQQFFINGGVQALIARIVHRDASGTVDETAPITDADIADPALEGQRRGLWLLDHTDLVNLLCIPPLSRTVDVAPTTWNAAIQYAKRRNAFVIIDPPSTWSTAAQAAAGADRLVNRDANAALYFPRILAPDCLNSKLPGSFAPCGAIAGIYARTDVSRGVWKAPAGIDGLLQGVTGFTVALNDRDNSSLNRLAINALRSFPTKGHIVWGARTLAGTDSLGSEWKYVNVRRLLLFVEESIDRGTQWAVFEPNADPLWAELRRSVGAFLHNLFRAGAFQGATEHEAYFVKCGTETTTRSDLDHGRLNLEVGFAPLKPAEFVVLKFVLKAAAELN